MPRCMPQIGLPVPMNLLQGPQHYLVAAERNDHVGFAGARGCHSGARERRRVEFRLGCSRHTDEGDAVAGSHRGRCRVGAAARWPLELRVGMDRAVYASIRPSLRLSRLRRPAGRWWKTGSPPASNILPGMISHYRWQGAVERAEEAVMLIKTRAYARRSRCAPQSKRRMSTRCWRISVLPIESVERA